MDYELAHIRKEYFKIKRYVRQKRIGQTAPVKMKSFSNGLLRIATLLFYNGIPVKYIHFYDLEIILEDASAADLPEIAAFSAVCPSIPRCAILAKRLKEIKPDIMILVGGAHVNQAPEETLRRFPEFDRLNEGYEMDAAEHIAGRSLSKTPEQYVDYNLLPYPLIEYSINTFTSVGCPFRCNYCVDGQAPYYRTMEDGQLQIMKSLLPERTVIHFFDSILGYDRQGAFQVCRKLEQLDHKFLLSCDMRADLMTPALAKAMERAGFVEVRMGLDTASEEILIKNGRTIMPDTLLNQLKMVRENSNLYISLYSITGLPGTTKELHQRMLECIAFLYENHLADEIKNAIYVPYPMKGVDYLSRGVTITDSDWSHYDRASFPVYRLEKVDENEIWNMFLQTARCLNENWLKSCGLGDISQVPEISDGFSEYYEANYK